MNGKDNDIGRMIAGIEPPAGAKERMLKNIEAKASDHTKTRTGVKRRSTFRRIMKLALPIAACFALSAIGIRLLPGLWGTSALNSPEPGGTMPQEVNPYRTVQNANEFVGALGIVVDAPIGAKEVEYFVINGTTANVNFRYRGNRYTLRASKQGGDFSGMYGPVIKIEQLDAVTNATLEIMRIDEHDCYKLTWTNGSTTFILMSVDGGSVDEIKEIYSLIK